MVSKYMSVRRVVLFDADGCMLRGTAENEEVTATSDGDYVDVGKRSSVSDAMEPSGFNKYVWDIEAAASARDDVRETVYASGSRRTGARIDLYNACRGESPLFVSFLKALNDRDGVTFVKDHLDDLFVEGGAYYDDFLAVITDFNRVYAGYNINGGSLTDGAEGVPQLTAESALLSKNPELISWFRGKLLEKLMAKNPKYTDMASCSRDKTKVALLYWRIHQQAKIAKAHGDTLELTLVDDREDILRKLTGFFKLYPKLLPKNATLSFVHHRSDNVLDRHPRSREVCEPIVGQGDIDPTPGNTVRILERSLFAGDHVKAGENRQDKKLLDRLSGLLGLNVEAAKGAAPWVFLPGIPKPNVADSASLKKLMQGVLPKRSYAAALKAGLMPAPPQVSTPATPASRAAQVPLSAAPEQHAGM
jgi:hypothetical protein